MKEYYDVVNEKLNNFSLNAGNSFFYHNFYEIYRLGSMFIKRVNKNFNEIGKTNCSLKIEMDGLTSLEIVKKFLEEIDPKLRVLFDEYFKKGSLHFVDIHDDNIYDNKISHVNRDICNIALEHNYEDPGIILHEFFHQTNRPKDGTESEARYVFGEGISIYFEDRILDYMETLGYDQEELAKIRMFRTKNSYSVAKDLVKYLPIFITFEELGPISENTYDLIEELFGSTFPYNRKEFDELIKEIQERFKRNSMKNPNYLSKYLFGDAVAKYLEMRPESENTTKKLLKLNEQINKVSIKDAIEILDISKDRIDISLECINSYDSYLKTNKKRLENIRKTK